MNRTANDIPRHRFRYANVISTLAVFVALGGTALATHPGGNNTIDSGDIVKDQVRSSDVRDDTLGGGGLKASDLRAGSVGGEEVTDDSLTGADVGSNSLAGSDIDEASLAQVPSALLGGFGRTGSENGCDPESATFVTCGETPSLTVPGGARALIIARLRARQSGDGTDLGDCGFARSTALGLLPNTRVTFDVPVSSNQHEVGTLVTVSSPQISGPVSYQLRCNEQSGDIFYDDVAVTALLISST